MLTLLPSRCLASLIAKITQHISQVLLPFKGSYQIYYSFSFKIFLNAHNGSLEKLHFSPNKLELPISFCLNCGV